MSMKAQTQVMSIVIITGIVIALVSSAYIWGKPLIEKRATISEYSSLESFVLELNDKIIDVANSNSGEYEIEIPFGIVSVVGYDKVSPDNNSILFEHVISQPIVLGSTVPVKTNNLQDIATYGEAQPRIITMSVSQTEGSSYLLKMKMNYRELDTNTLPRKGFIIRLKEPSAVFDSGKSTIRVSFDSNEVVSGSAANLGDLIVTYINIDII